MTIEPIWTLKPELLAEASKITFKGALGVALEGPIMDLPEGEGEWISGTIFFSGDWAGLLRLDLPDALARDLTGAWRGEDPAGLDRAAVNDAMGELANTVAGILKPSLAGIRSMSVPRVANTSKALTIKGKKDILGATLRSQNHLFQLSIWKCPPQFKMETVPKPDLYAHIPDRPLR